jgi:hypothetical protein
MDKYRGRRSGEKHEEREEMKQVEKKIKNQDKMLKKKSKKGIHYTHPGECMDEARGPVRQADLLASGYRPRLTCIARAVR